MLRLLVAHQALLGAGGDLPDRGADLAGQLQGQQHLPELRQPARRAAAGVDHRPDRHGDDGGDPDRRDRPLGRLDHGALLGGLRDAADGAGLDAGGGDGRPGAGADRASWCWRGHALRVPQRCVGAGGGGPAARSGARSAARAGCCRPSAGLAGVALALWFAAAAGGDASSGWSACCWWRPPSG